MKAPILVTGIHNSGTTWVGRNMALSDEVGYIYEPFNPDWKKPGMKGAKFDYYYTYISQDNEHHFLSGMRQTLAFHYNPLVTMRRKLDSRWKARVRSAFKDWLYYTRCKLEKRAPLLKDPIALLSAEWLAERFDMRVIVLIRHPAAFVNSIQTKGWRQPYKSLLNQPELMRDRLSPFQEDMQRYRDEKHTTADEASFMWKILYSQVVGYQQRHPDWVFVRHEDLSLDPVGEFRKLFSYCGLKYTDEIVRGIEIRSGLAPRPEDVNPDRTVMRDSRANMHLWKEKLTPEEIDVVRANVCGVSERFYSDKDW